MFLKKDTGAVGVTPWLRKALPILSEDLASGPLTHVVAQNLLTPVPEDPEPLLNLPMHTCDIHTWRQNIDMKPI